MNIVRWLKLMESWGFGLNQQTFDALVKAYGERHRHYHTAEHIDACLRNLDRSALQLEHPHEVELALWFHDAVYNPLSKNNELESAHWAASFLSENNVPNDANERVQALIMATVHDAPALSKDASLLILTWPFWVLNHRPMSHSKTRSERNTDLFQRSFIGKSERRF